MKEDGFSLHAVSLSGYCLSNRFHTSRCVDETGASGMLPPARLTPQSEPRDADYGSGLSPRGPSSWLAFLWSCGVSCGACLTWPSSQVVYMPRHRSTSHPVPHDAPVGWAAHHHFPRLAMWAAQDVPPSRIAVPPRAAGSSVSAIGGSPCRWLYDSWGGDRPAVVGGRVLCVCPGGTCFVAQQGCSAPELASGE